MKKRRRQTPSSERAAPGPPGTPGPPDSGVAPIASPAVARVLALGAVAYGAAVALSSMHPRPITWGLDAPGYLPAPLRALTLGILAIGVALVVAATARPAPTTKPPPRAQKASSGAGWRVWIPLLLLLFAALWLLRVRSFFLGDQEVWLDNIRADKYPLYSEPLAALAWRGYVLLLRLLSIPPRETWLAVLPVLCGLAAAPLAWRIARYASRDRRARVLALGLIATLGATQLYCGYLESYALVTVAVLLYVAAAMRHVHDGGSLLVVGLALALAVATHLVALFLIPSYILLVWRERATAARRAALLLLPILAACAVGWLLALRGGSLTRPFEVLRVALVNAGSGGAHPVGVAGRLADFANMVFLTMPVPALLLISGTFAGSFRARLASRGMAFLMSAAIPGVFVAAALVLPGSPVQDWDLLAVTMLPAALVGIFLGLSSSPGSPSGRLRIGLTALALGPLLAFVLVNANEGAGTRRFKTIIDPSVALSPHERAYANEKLVKYYNARQEAESTLVYAQRALAAERGNPRYHANIGSALYNLHRYSEAAPYFEEAIRGGLDRAEVYYQLGLCYMHERRFTDAVAKFRAAVDRSATPEYLHNLGLAMLATGDGNSAYSVLMYVREHWPEYEPTERALEKYFGGAPERSGP